MLTSTLMPQCRLSMASNVVPAVFVISHDGAARAALRQTLEMNGHLVQDYPSADAFLDAYRPRREACLLIDAALPGVEALELLRHLRRLSDQLPTVLIAAASDVPMAVRAIKAGALDVFEKPIPTDDLLAAIDRGFAQSRDADTASGWHAVAAARIPGLTQRQREVAALVLAGQPSKNIAADLGISQRTVENHRAMIRRRTGTRSLPALTRLALSTAFADA